MRFVTTVWTDLRCFCYTDVKDLMDILPKYGTFILKYCTSKYVYFDSSWLNICWTSKDKYSEKKEHFKPQHVKHIEIEGIVLLQCDVRSLPDYVHYLTTELWKICGRDEQTSGTWIVVIITTVWATVRTVTLPRRLTVYRQDARFPSTINET